MPNDREDPQSNSEAKAQTPDKARLVKAGVAVGIGSAAIVAALLYANRSKRNDRN